MKINSTRHKFKISFACSFLLVLAVGGPSFAQRRRIPTGGRLAIVADERLSALRAAPNLSAKLVERLRRGRFVAILGTKRTQDGITFYHVKASRRRSGWVQSDALVSSTQAAGDQRLIQLIRGADEFERVARARVFLQMFPRSPLRPQVLLLYAEAAEDAASKLSREAERRFEKTEIPGDGAPEFSYFLNYSGLDRYNRQGVTFVFDRRAKQFHYEGWAWREIIRRYPGSPDAEEARKRLEVLARLAQR